MWEEVASVLHFPGCRSMAHLCVTVARASVTRVLSAGYVLSSAQTFRLFRRSGAVAREFPPPLGVSSEKPHVVSLRWHSACLSPRRRASRLQSRRVSVLQSWSRLRKTGWSRLRKTGWFNSISIWSRVDRLGSELTELTFDMRVDFLTDRRLSVLDLSKGVLTRFFALISDLEFV